MVFSHAPTLETGTARVVQNLLRIWRDQFERIDIWGIGYRGWRGAPGQVEGSEWQKPPFVLYPAAYGEKMWFHKQHLQDFLDHLTLRDSDYTHVWLLEDHFWLAQHGFPAALRQAAQLKGFKTFFYVPVDGTMDPEWTAPAAAVDVPVAFTEYGRGELEAQNPTLRGRIEVLPHGVDPEVYRPLPLADRAALREKFFGDWIEPGDVVLVNVNVHQRRKDVVRSLEVLAELHRRGATHYKLLMHMAETSKAPDEVSLEAAARQLGLTPQQWRHSGGLFEGNRPALTEAGLNQLYNAADVVFSTTLGEGWGLAITEGLAAGAPVAVPDNTACREIAAYVTEHGMPDRAVVLPVERGFLSLPIDNTRLRRRVDVAGAADALLQAEADGWFKPERRAGLSAEVKEWLSWRRLGQRWLELFSSPKVIRRVEAPDERWLGAPSILKQTTWPCGFFHFQGQHPGEVQFNPTLVTKGSVPTIDTQPDPLAGTYLVTRCTNNNQNEIRFYPLDVAKMELKSGVDRGVQRVLARINSHEKEEHFEDPRCVADPRTGGLWLSFCHYRQQGRDLMPHQTLMELGPRFENRGLHHVVHGKNGPGVMQNSGPEKNWIWFLDRDPAAASMSLVRTDPYLDRDPAAASMSLVRTDPYSDPSLRMIYSIAPHEVVAVSREGKVVEKWRTESTLPLPWKHGTPRGGTPPVRIQRPGAEPEYLSFFHSSIPWSKSAWSKRRYLMGAYTFEARAPYRVTAMTPEPLLAGSEADPMLPWSPLVVFPSGLLDVGEHLLVSLGVNDAACAWIKVPKTDLWKRLKCTQTE